MLSILSYSRENTDTLPGSLIELLKHNGSYGVSNVLGEFGAWLAMITVHKTIGVFSLSFAFCFAIWGIHLLRPLDILFLIRSSNIALGLGLLFSWGGGIMRSMVSTWKETVGLSGEIGMAIGEKSIGFIGAVGSLLFFLLFLGVAVMVIFRIRFSTLISTTESKITALKEQAKERKEAEEAERLLAEKEEKKREKEREKERKQSGRNKEKSPDKKAAPARSTVETVQPTSVEEEEAGPVITTITIKEKPAEVIDATGQVKQTVTVEGKKDETAQAKKPVRTKQTAETIDTAAEEQPKREVPVEVKTETLKVIKPEKKEPVPVPMPVSHEANDDPDLPEQWDETIVYEAPSLDLLTEPKEEAITVANEELARKGELLREKLDIFGIIVEKIEVTPGPVVTLFELSLEKSVKINRITSLENDIALALAARGIRIIAPIPGKSTVGIEIPNEKPATVFARTVIQALQGVNASLPMALGKTVTGEVMVADLARMPHLLIAGSTGSGKSVGVNMMIASVLYTRHPQDVKFVIIDPKKIELNLYDQIRDFFLAKSPDLDEYIVTDPMHAVLLLKAVEMEMDKRYNMLAKVRARNIIEYNQRVMGPDKPRDTDTIKHHKLPYIVVIVDELADLMMTSGKEVEEPITRLAQLARAVGIHLIVATQRPSVNVITGIIKANFPARIAYQVASKIDSRTILDSNGAEQLLGRGDMLFLPSDQPKPIRLQNAFLSTEEVERIVNNIFRPPHQTGFSKPYLLPSLNDKKKGGGDDKLLDLDDAFQDAARIIVRTKQASVSMLQRRLKLGYSRAARVMDQLEAAGVVGPSEGSKTREVLIDDEEQLENVFRLYM